MDQQARLEILRKAPLDSWIALSQDETRLVGVGKTYEECVAAAEQSGESDFIHLKTPPEWLPLAL
ncbi:MAG: hypothetical protein ACRD2Q_11585 [Terriglobales bacterium]